MPGEWHHCPCDNFKLIGLPLLITCSPDDHAHLNKCSSLLITTGPPSTFCRMVKRGLANFAFKAFLSCFLLSRQRFLMLDLNGLLEAATSNQQNKSQRYMHIFAACHRWSLVSISMLKSVLICPSDYCSLRWVLVPKSAAPTSDASNSS